ncbi:MAG: HesA/MoeB/ThiF family protein [Bacteroidota bacterium]
MKLQNAKVLVIGAGGLGCPVLQYLTAMGVGTIGIVDFDVVEASNLHRQVLYTPQDLAKKKVDVAMEKLSAQNPDVKLVKHDMMLTDLNAKELISQYDLVVDGCDNFLTRYTVNDTCVALSKPLVYGSILGDQGQLATFNFHGSKNLRDLFPEPPNAEDVPNCSENGVLGVVPGIVGTMMAREVVSVLVGSPTLVNQFCLYDTQQFTLTKLLY